MIDIDIVKNHCRIEPDFNDDDNLLAIYTNSAARYVEKWTRRTIYKAETDEGYAEDEDHLLLTDDVKSAMLLLIGHWYESREAVTLGQAVSTIPFAVEAILQPYRIYGL